MISRVRFQRWNYLADRNDRSVNWNHFHPTDSPIRGTGRNLILPSLPSKKNKETRIKQERWKCCKIKSQFTRSKVRNEKTTDASNQNGPANSTWISIFKQMTPNHVKSEDPMLPHSVGRIRGEWRKFENNTKNSPEKCQTKTNVITLTLQFYVVK